MTRSAAAVLGQRAMAAEPWPDGAEVRVRMGIHTGEIESIGGDVIGYDINRTARIAALAHGGQVLLSGTTRALVADALPSDVTLRDLGAHRLKDLRAPEHLSQLAIEGLPDTFPPLRSLDARPNNLPTQLTTFVGRDRELAEAGDLLRGTRLLSLTGPGGTGKTRLSLQVAATAADDFPDGVWFVALDAVRDPALVTPTIARTVGLAENATKPSIEVLADEVAAGRVLLVLDNFEQVTEAGPDVAELLRRCPNLKALVTTRIPLRVSGEQEYPVPGLPAPPDVEPALRDGAPEPAARAARTRHRCAHPVRGGATVHRPGDRDPTGVRRHECECARGRRHRRPIARHAAGDRAGRRADQAVDSGPDPRPARASPRPALGRSARPARAAADAARRDRLELRPAR